MSQYPIKLKSFQIGDFWIIDRRNLSKQVKSHAAVLLAKDGYNYLVDELNPGAGEEDRQFCVVPERKYRVAILEDFRAYIKANPDSRITAEDYVRDIWTPPVLNDTQEDRELTSLRLGIARSGDRKLLGTVSMYNFKMMQRDPLTIETVLFPAFHDPDADVTVDGVNYLFRTTAMLYRWMLTNPLIMADDSEILIGRFVIPIDLPEYRLLADSQFGQLLASGLGDIAVIETDTIDNTLTVTGLKRKVRAGDAR